jgi:hypothetical protein
LLRSPVRDEEDAAVVIGPGAGAGRRRGVAGGEHSRSGRAAPARIACWRAGDGFGSAEGGIWFGFDLISCWIESGGEGRKEDDAREKKEGGY